MAALLEIQELRTYFSSPYGIVRAVDCVNLELARGETLGIVGESGCGKTVLSLSIMRLIPEPPGKIEGGRILLNGVDLLTLSADEMRDIRGRDISMIFQEPMTALNPVFRIGNQITEVVRTHQKVSYKDAFDQAVIMLQKVGIPSPEKRVHDYPHQLSGGMRQRVMIAMALICKPQLMLADEPTTALDVTIQAQILDLLRQMKNDLHTSIILITHDLGVVAQSAQKMAVMYAGEIVEYADVSDIFSNPSHPYTVGLLESIPPLKGKYSRNARLRTISGTVPELYKSKKGCRFQDRCIDLMKVCTEEKPSLLPLVGTHFVRCWKRR
ncbi:MAG: Oligopeptide transport ATP-binding protein OppD [Syntrophus sp. SKADARSKE-3]|nr:Oligopeptide transport ATP-binding protein OppD [Syntrophus sp. SKADARSKE-3]